MERKKDWLKLLLAPVLLCTVALSRAQVTITAMVPGGGVYLKPQLWNLTVANTGTSAVNAQVRMEMRDLQTHETVLSAVSAGFSVQPGARALQAQSLQPIRYTYASGPGDRSPDGMLPVGRYQVCYQLYVSVREQLEPAADDCAQLEVEPLSPPLLTMPEDSARVGTPTPAFTWVPPGPLSMFGSLNYDFLLTEVYPGQSATDAVQRNLPLQQASGLLRPFLQYPLQSVALDTAKLYAWQVTARDGSRFAAKSEAWVFRLKPSQTLQKMLSIAPFVQFRKEGTQMAVAPNGILKFSYDHRSTSDSVTVSIRSLGVVGAESVATFGLQVHPGENYIQEAIGKHMKVEDGHIYMAELTNSDGEHYSLRFQARHFND